MPTIYFARDGRRPNTQEGPGIQATFPEVAEILRGYELIHVGDEAPSINPDSPSHSVKNVVVHVEPEEGVSDQFPNLGFYIVRGVSPEQVTQALEKMRE